MAPRGEEVPGADLDWLVMLWRGGGAQSQDDQSDLARQLSRLVWAQLKRRPVYGMDQGEAAARLVARAMRRLHRFNPARGKCSTFLYWVIRSGITDERRGQATQHTLMVPAWQHDAARLALGEDVGRDDL
jgi:hypothetical protein